MSTTQFCSVKSRKGEAGTQVENELVNARHLLAFSHGCSQQLIYATAANVVTGI
jgi:hypothetical protein